MDRRGLGTRGRVHPCRAAARLVLLAALILGLVAMHQLSGCGCCVGEQAASGTDAAGSGETAVDAGAVGALPAQLPVLVDATVSVPARSTTAVDADGDAGRGPDAGMVGVCLAMLVALGAALGFLSALLRGRGRDRRGPRPTIVAFAASPRGPPRPCLAQLQVLRL